MEQIPPIKPPIPASPFFNPGPTTSPNSLALLHLRRDQIQPTTLSAASDAISNTRFGNYPHATLLSVPWGSQVLASNVAQDSRAKRSLKAKAGGSGNAGKKRKRDDADDEDAGDNDEEGLVILGAAGTGFAYVLSPTPELWTQSLPHRTQVVYTPDYSYVLHRLNVRPGSVIIEAGAGSGSFTHAAARAVYGGDAEPGDLDAGGNRKRRKKAGKVYSFEYHEPRAQQLAAELKEHGLQDIVTVTHRDVYQNGFNLGRRHGGDATAVSLQATAVFLDLPAPWLALKHLVRKSLSAAPAVGTTDAPSEDSTSTAAIPFTSPLSTTSTVQLCTFSPCIEQVSRTVSTLRTLGWTDIAMTELLHRRLDIRRERFGVAEEGSRDGNPVPASVEEAVTRLREVKEAEERGRSAVKEREARVMAEMGIGKDEARDELTKAVKKMMREEKKERGGNGPGIKGKRLEKLEAEREGRKMWKEGRIVVRTEPELKGHTSYLVFATLPREWSKEDEEAAAKKTERMMDKVKENGEKLNGTRA